MVTPDQITAARPSPVTDWAALCRPFDVTFSDTRGGVTFDYFTGEQARSRMNEVFGHAGWEAQVRRHWIDAVAEEVVVLIRLTCRVVEEDVNAPGTYVVRFVSKENFGSQKIKKSRSTGIPLDVGFEFKGAETDALKKAFADFGGGLYLWQKKGGRLTIPDDGVPLHYEASDARQDAPTGPQPTPMAPNGTQASPTPVRPTQPAKPEPLALPVGERAAQENRYRSLRVDALDAGMRGSWIETEPEKWTDVQLVKYCELFDRFITANPRRVVA